MKRILIFSHFNQQGLLSSYVVFMLEEIRPMFERVVFVSNSKIDQDARKRLLPFTDKILERGNSGFDFGAWKQAILEEGWDAFDSYDSLTIMNDTCFGPFYDMREVFEKMETSDVDFWGLTNHKALSFGMPGSEDPVPEHIQSYFISFSRRMISSEVFAKFWKSVQNFKDVNKIILHYETKLANIFQKSGFTFKVYFDTTDIKYDFVNFTAFRPDYLIEQKCPLIKVKGFIQFDNPVYLKQLVKKLTNYDFNLIEDHFNQTYIPNISLRVTDNVFITNQSNEHSGYGTLKVAIHFHVTYVDLFEKCLKELVNVNNKPDLYITTDNEEKKRLISNSIKSQPIPFILKEIFVGEGIGSNYIQWLKISDDLKKYDLVGHFQTINEDPRVYTKHSSWSEELYDTLLRPANEIIELFEKESALGILISDIPKSLRYIDKEMWIESKNRFSRLWKKMGCKKTINTSLISTPLMPYGSMFWYRPVAIKPLTDQEIIKDEFERDAHSEADSIEFTLGSLLVYVAWDQGFDFKIALSRNYIFSGFDQNLLTEIKIEHENLLKSNTWKAGLFVTWLPKKFSNAIDFIKKLIQ
jgi:rhamnosyltransferase